MLFDIFSFVVGKVGEANLRATGKAGVPDSLHLCFGIFDVNNVALVGLTIRVKKEKETADLLYFVQLKNFLFSLFPPPSPLFLS